MFFDVPAMALKYGTGTIRDLRLRKSNLVSIIRNIGETFRHGVCVRGVGWWTAGERFSLHGVDSAGFAEATN